MVQIPLKEYIELVRQRWKEYCQETDPYKEEYIFKCIRELSERMKAEGEIVWTKECTIASIYCCQVIKLMLYNVSGGFLPDLIRRGIEAQEHICIEMERMSKE